MICGIKRSTTSDNCLVRGLEILSVSILVLLWAAGGAVASEKDSVVAVVNGQELRLIHFDRVMNKVLPMASFHGGISEEKKAKHWKEAMDRLIDEELIYQEAKRQGVKPDKKAVRSKFKETISKVGGRANFEKSLAHHGIDEKEFKRMLAAPAMVKKTIARMMEKGAKVSDTEISDYYEKNRLTHFVTEKKRFLHMVFKTDPGEIASWGVKEERGRDILERIRQGADFKEMVRNFSEGVRKDKDGDTGYVARAQLPSELAKAGWELKDGEVSDLIKSIHGFHILKAVGEPIDDVMSLEVAHGQIKAALLSDKKQKLKEGLLMELRKKASIKVVGEAGE